jgi:tetratricopeptide (TPR) repeat protein
VFRIVQREILLLIVLGGLLIALFLLTRSMAERNRSMNIETAATWYRLGQEQMNNGDAKAAIESFRNAATNDHDNAQYTLVLATALGAADHTDEARQALLRLRGSSPESGEINLNLARLAAKQGEIAEAVRYYHNALFGVWPPSETSNQRSRVRTELVRFLLDRGQAGQALPELLILSSDIPDTERAHMDLGRLFLTAGDSQHALEEFKRVLQINRQNGTALSGAGQAAYNLMDYNRARGYLEAAVSGGIQSSTESTLLATTKLVLSNDPLVSGIRTEERIRRVMADLNSASEDLRSCISKKQNDQSSLVVLEPLWIEIDQYMEPQFHPTVFRRDPEEFTTALNLIRRVEVATEEICAESSPIHTALLLIARKHGVGEQ